jgi:uncharacterized protein
MERRSELDSLLEEPEFRALRAILREMGSVVVAYSGGADSTFLLKVAREVLGEQARGVLAVSESLDRNELEEAQRTAAALELPIVIIETREYDNPEYRRNDGDRCYHCKTELFGEVWKYAQREGVPYVLDGSHAGDVGDWRPGLRARNEQGVRSPLLEAGLHKEHIRRYSRALGLPTWDKPAAPCLSSRIPYGDEVTREKLRQVEAAEKTLRDLGFRTVRVRHHDSVARIEVPLERLQELFEPETLRAVVEGVKKAGFLFVACDLEGFRSGSLNAALAAGAPAPLVQLESL